MQVVFFALKRAYHGVLRITREPLRDFGLTPARFDMLYAVKECPGGVLQSALRRMLGVCRATASKMLISLEELGLVKRTVYPYDRRQRLVRLTGYGRRSIRDAKEGFMRSGWAEFAFASAIGSTGLCHWYDEDGCFEQKTWLLERLDALRNGFFDVASLEYPRAHLQMPDDLEDLAFAEPWEDILACEEKDGANAAPPGATWSWSREAVAREGGGAGGSVDEPSHGTTRGLRPGTSGRAARERVAHGREARRAVHESRRHASISFVAGSVRQRAGTCPGTSTKGCGNGRRRLAAPGELARTPFSTLRNSAKKPELMAKANA